MLLLQDYLCQILSVYTRSKGIAISGWTQTKIFDDGVYFKYC